MQPNKKQHYVPQHFMRNFSSDGKSIFLFNLKTNKIHVCQIKDLCQKKYFYSESSEIDKALSIAESQHAGVIKNIISEKKLNLNKQDYMTFLNFLTVQYTRSLQSKIKVKDMTKFLVENIIKIELSKNAGISKESLDKIEISHPADHIYLILQGMYGQNLICDLQPLLIFNNTEKDFISSDNPVVFYNSFFCKLKQGVTGLTSSGLQVICPINQKLLFLLYDSNYYEVNNKSYEITIDKNEDIEALNALQVINATEVIYFNKNIDIKELTKKYSQKTKPVIKLKIYNLNNREILAANGIHSNYQLNLSFMKFKDTQVPFKPIRNIKLYNFHNESIAELEKKFSQSTSL